MMLLVTGVGPHLILDSSRLALWNVQPNFFSVYELHNIPAFSQSIHTSYDARSNASWSTRFAIRYRSVKTDNVNELMERTRTNGVNREGSVQAQTKA